MTKLFKENIDVFRRLTKDRIRKAHKRYENKKVDSHTYGQVKAINPDGSYQVRLNESSVNTRCVNCCTAMVGDIVHVCIKADGKCVAEGRVGGESKGGSIKSGETDGWYWEKWDNGKAYCRKRTLVSWTTGISSWGGAYESTDLYTNGDYPFEFYEVPAADVYIEGSGQGNYMNGTRTTGAVFGTAKTSPKVYLQNDNGSTDWDKGGYLVTEAEGFWKEPDETEIYAIGGGLSGGSCGCDVEGAIAKHNADEDAHQDIRNRIEEIAASGGSGGSGGTGFFTLEVDEDGNLYAVYDDPDNPPSFELDEEGNLYYIIEEGE